MVGAFIYSDSKCSLADLALSLLVSHPGVGCRTAHI